MPLTTISKILPKLSDVESLEKIVYLSETAAAIGKGSLSFIFIVNLLLQYSLQSFLSQVRNLSISTHLFFTALSYPPNVIEFFSEIF